MKKCAKCLLDVPLVGFYKDAQRKGGLDTYCKPCRNVVNKKSATPAAVRSAKRAYKERQKAATFEERKAKKLARAERARLNRCRIKREWKTRNPSQASGDKAKRRASVLSATPSWGEEFIIREAYVLAHLRTAVFNFKWHVDHIVPLCSEIVCGLHTHHNLQVIPAVSNLRKGNRVWPGMPA